MKKDEKLAYLKDANDYLKSKLLSRKQNVSYEILLTRNRMLTITFRHLFRMLNVAYLCRMLLKS